MSTTDNAPDSTRDGGEKSNRYGPRDDVSPYETPKPKFEDFIDKAREMVCIPPALFELLSDYESIDSIRITLKSWFIAFVLQDQGPGTGPGDTELFDYLDEFLIKLYRVVLAHEISKSDNNHSTDSKQ